MNPFKWLANLFKNIKQLFVRAGLDKFLGSYIQVAVEIVAQLALVNNNADFHKWKDAAFDAVKNRIGKPIADNWIAILIALAYENFKAQKPGTSRIEVK